MTDDEAADVVAAMRPRLVIPCHDDCPALFRRAYNPADPDPFMASVLAAGSGCAALRPGKSARLEAKAALHHARRAGEADRR